MEDGVRAQGATYALFSFTRKLGQAFGGATAAYTIALGGYVAGAAQQSSTTVGAIKLVGGALPDIFILMASE